MEFLKQPHKLLEQPWRRWVLSHTKWWHQYSLAKGLAMLVGFHDVISFYGTQNAHESSVLATAYNSQKSLWTLFMDLLRIKPTFDKPKLSHPLPENYCSMGVRYNNACMDSTKMERCKRFWAQDRLFQGQRHLIQRGLRPLKIIPVSSTEQAWSCTNLLKLHLERDFYISYSSQE